MRSFVTLGLKKFFSTYRSTRKGRQATPGGYSMQVMIKTFWNYNVSKKASVLI